MVIQVVEISTRDPDVANKALNDAYMSDRPVKIHGSSHDFLCEMRFATSSSGLGADRAMHSMGATLTAQFDGSLIVSIAQGGDQLNRVKRDEIYMRPGTIMRCPTGVAFHSHWSSIDTRIIRLPLAVVDRVASETLGATRPVRFHGMKPHSSRHAAQWRSLAAFVHRYLESDENSTQHDLLDLRLAELVAAAALHVFPNDGTDLYARHPPTVAGGTTLRRAVAFLEANADRPLTVSDVARVAGVSPRTLQAAFRRHYGLSPMAYLREIRLRAARQDLFDGDPKVDTVAAVSSRWGFTSPSRFSAYYRDRFRCLPSDDLRR